MERDQVKAHALLPEDARVYQLYALYQVGPFATGIHDFNFEGKTFAHRRPEVGRVQRPE